RSRWPTSGWWSRPGVRVLPARSAGFPFRTVRVVPPMNVRDAPSASSAPRPRIGFFVGTDATGRVALGGQQFGVDRRILPRGPTRGPMSGASAPPSVAAPRVALLTSGGGPQLIACCASLTTWRCTGPRSRIMTASLKCPKCSGLMEQGFVLDNTHGGNLVSHWARGAPLKSLLFGTKRPEAQLPIGTFRCSSCGYLEAYAREEFAAT